MTALDKYVRLESEGLWRDAPEGQRRAVTLSFGDATLVIADAAGRPLSHWSLPALIRQNPEARPALYAPDDAASELLEIADDMMVAAIEEVRAALDKQRPRPGKLRVWLLLALLTGTLALAVFWLPSAQTRQTLAVVPASGRAAIGAEILAHMTEATGPECTAAGAAPAAARLATRLFGPASPARILVLPDFPARAAVLPGDLYILSAQSLMQADDPAVAAGLILSARARVKAQSPLADILARAGLGATFRLLVTGALPEAVLQAEAARALQTSQSPAEALRDLMAQAQIPQAPYLAALDAQTGSMPDLGPDPLRGADIPLILTDGDWLNLQNICNG